MSYFGEHEDMREEFAHNSRYWRRLQADCQGSPICGCPVCEPDNHNDCRDPQHEGCGSCEGDANEI